MCGINFRLINVAGLHTHSSAHFGVSIASCRYLIFNTERCLVHVSMLEKAIRRVNEQSFLLLAGVLGSIGGGRALDLSGSNLQVCLVEGRQKHIYICYMFIVNYREI